jgi:hypothetical protein
VFLFVFTSFALSFFMSFCLSSCLCGPLPLSFSHLIDSLYPQILSHWIWRVCGTLKFQTFSFFFRFFRFLMMFQREEQNIGQICMCKNP